MCVLQFVADVFQFVSEQGTFDWAVRKVSAKQSIYLMQSFSQACDGVLHIRLRVVELGVLKMPAFQ